MNSNLDVKFITRHFKISSMHVRGRLAGQGSGREIEPPVRRHSTPSVSRVLLLLLRVSECVNRADIRYAVHEKNGETLRRKRRGALCSLPLLFSLSWHALWCSSGAGRGAQDAPHILESERMSQSPPLISGGGRTHASKIFQVWPQNWHQG